VMTESLVAQPGVEFRTWLHGASCEGPES